MTLMHGLTAGETQLAMSLSATNPKERKSVTSNAGNTLPEEYVVPTFSMKLVYDMEVPKDPDTVKKQAKESERHDAPYFATGESESSGRIVYPQAIAALQNRINEANLLGETYGDPQARRAILMGALGKAQGLITSCLDAMDTTGTSAEAASYITDLSRLHTRILHSLSQMKDPEKKGTHSASTGTPSHMGATTATPSSFRL